MIPARLFLIVGALTSCFVQFAYTIKCYQCESDNIEQCGNDFDGEAVLLDDCGKIPPPRHLMHTLGPNSNATGCTTIKADRYGNTVIIRSCYFGTVPTNTESGCTHNPAEPGVTYKHCDVCTTDACNRSNINGPVILTIFLSAVLARLISFT